MDKIIRIGTRSSELALWQANTVAKQLDDLGYKSEIVKIDSIGDVILVFNIFKGFSFVENFEVQN